MTIQFTPGDVNASPSASCQSQWKSHHIIAYASGNNLIIYTVSDHQRQSLQTVYLSQDAATVAVNPTNGLICIACGSEIIVFKPVNEYMAVPKWTEAVRFQNGESLVHCVEWASLENELAVGCEQAISLYHINYEYGEVSHSLRWHKRQPSPVEGLDISADGTRLASYNYSKFDSFAKVWMRISFGDSNSLFELTYADHNPSLYLVYFRWRRKQTPRTPSRTEDSSAMASMANIKNIRSFMPALVADDSDILYTVTNDHVLNVWATYEFNGHSFLKLWAHYDLQSLSGNNYMSFLLLENVHIRAYLSKLASMPASLSSFLAKRDISNFDLLFILGKTTSHLVGISNITDNPPSGITFNHICSFNTSSPTLPSYLASNIAFPENVLDQNGSLHNSIDSELRNHFFDNSSSVYSTQTFLKTNNPLLAGHLVSTSDSGDLSFLLHDRLKNTLRLESVRFDEKPSIELLNKFQGHDKSVRQMYMSSSSHEGNIMLSISDFPAHNYIWEPILVGSSDSPSLAITKRFRLDVTRDVEQDPFKQGIVNAVLINDIYPANKTLRHHLAIVIERGGYFSIWDCDGSSMDDSDAALVERLSITDNACQLSQTPDVFFSKTISDSSLAVIAVYNPTLIKSWKIEIGPKINNKSNIKCFEIISQNLPGEYTGSTKIAALNTYLEKDISVIDEEGLLRSLSVDFDIDKKILQWSKTSHLHTNIVRATLLRGASLVGKLAIVNEKGNTLSIWDSDTGVLEYEETFPNDYGAVRDLDWTFIGEQSTTANTILAVGFARTVFLYTQLRYDYTNDVSTFTVLKKIDISDYTSHEIGDSIWLDNLYLVISSGNQFFIDDKWVQLGQNTGTSTSGAMDSTIRQLLVGYNSKHSVYQISDLVRILNGPLPVYHPQFLIQALLMGENELVEGVLVKLLKFLRSDKFITWDLDIEMADFIVRCANQSPRRSSIFGVSDSTDMDIFDFFNSTVAELLSEKLTSISLPLLTRHQQVTLRNLVLLIDKLRSLKTSLDPNGMKFMYGFELFLSSSKQKKLNMRDINWAVHSDQKEMLFQTIEKHYKRLTWSEVKKVGLAYWVDDFRLRTVLETVARNEFATARDPSGRISILFMAINKKQVLLGLWKTVSHPEKDKMVKFLSNNFNEPRWKSAALKNAFVLLSKHRYLDAAYFFLLAEKVSDCCMTLCRKGEDVDLALAIARVSTEPDCVKQILERYILPTSISSGDRWTTSCAFWRMNLKEISIQALVLSPINVVKRYLEHFSDSFREDIKAIPIETSSKSFLRVDPALGVLYQQLRASKSRYLQGSKAVSLEEFDFVIRLATIYARMGCDYLSLLLVMNWSFLDSAGETKRTYTSVPTKDIFSDFSGAATSSQKIVPAPTSFEEPDMSSFSFGF